MVQFAVISKAARWCVMRDRSVVLEGVSRSEAIASAERMALTAESEGRRAQLLVQDCSGQLHERLSGIDR